MLSPEIKDAHPKAYFSDSNLNPDLNSVQYWVSRLAQLVKEPKISINTEYWREFGSNMIVFSHEANYTINAITGLCENYAIDLAELPTEVETAEDLINQLHNKVGKLTLLMVTDAKFIISTSENQTAGVVKRLADLMDKSSPSHPVLVVLITHVDTYQQIDPMLRMVGRFERKLLLQNQSPLQLGMDFISRIPEHLRGQGLDSHIEKIGKLLQLEFSETRKIDLILKHLIREASEQDQTIGIRDIIRVAQTGSIKTFYPPSDPLQNEQIAVHEAGHAVIAMLLSNGRVIPDYLTIRESLNYRGLMVEDYHYRHAFAQAATLADSVNHLKTVIAGRIAVDIYFSVEQRFYAGDKADLERANQFARELIVDFGVLPPEPSLGKEYQLGLFIPDDSADAIREVNLKIKDLLALEQQNVHALLNEHQALLRLVADALLSHEELFYDDLATLWQTYWECKVYPNDSE